MAGGVGDERHDAGVFEDPRCAFVWKYEGLEPLGERVRPAIEFLVRDDPPGRPPAGRGLVNGNASGPALSRHSEERTQIVR